MSAADSGSGLLIEGVNPSGPVFISYRWDPVSDHVRDVARRLRASGVPVWLDRTDLPPGDTTTRLNEALAAGLSGAILVATESIKRKESAHDAIHDIELPRLLELDKDTRFTLAVLSTIPRADDPGRIDRKRTGELYERAETEGLTHYSSFNRSIAGIGQAFAKERLENLRDRRGESLTIDIQTRRASTAFASPADLVFRTVPPAESRVPSRTVWEDLQDFLAWLPTTIADQGSTAVQLVGGAHLSLAFGFGAALPEPASIPLSVRATDEAIWKLTAKRLTWRERIPLIGFAPKVRTVWRGHGAALAVFIDLVSTPAPRTFEHYLDGHRAEFAKGLVIDVNRRLGPDDGPRTIAEVAAIVRREAAAHGSTVHLFLRAPWAAAALLGASLNTITATLYEWENTVSPPDYIKTITVAAGLGGGPITSIHMP